METRSLQSFFLRRLRLEYSLYDESEESEGEESEKLGSESGSALCLVPAWVGFHVA